VDKKSALEKEVKTWGII